MKKRTFTSETLDTELLERLADAVHQEWMHQRILDGWVWGPKRDDTLKTHPCLVPFEDLPEEEKEYDRHSAMTTLRMIRELGYRIVPMTEERHH